jgi:hypothetical protein
VHLLGDHAELVVADELGLGALADFIGVADVVDVAVTGDDDIGLSDLAELHLGGGVVVEPGVEIGDDLSDSKRNEACPI